jgi:transketolase
MNPMTGNTWKNRGNRPTRAGFGEGLLAAGQIDQSVVCLGSDITGSVGCDLFANAFPDRFISLGIAEQNCAGVAAGLALAGKIPVFSTYGVFAALRATDQIRVSVCYNNLHVVIGGAHSGVSVGPDGATHQALEDIGIMRVLPGMTVLSPCDATQTKKATLNAIENCQGPVYIRFGREAMPDFTNENEPFIIGRAQVMKQGTDLTVIATGHMVWEAIMAATELEQTGISARVLNIHSIKPLDIDSIVAAARETGAIITAEEHQIMTGLGSAVAETLVQHYPVPMNMIGMRDRFGESGRPSELMEKFGLSSKYIISEAISLLKRKTGQEFQV